jgi:flagellar hook-basal body complex protein FliE
MTLAPLEPGLYGPSQSPEARPPAAEREPAAAEGPSFADLLRQVMKSEAAAQHGVDTYAIGQHQNLHETMIALEKADISLSLLVSVRNKLLEAYREVMRMS